MSVASVYFYTRFLRFAMASCLVLVSWTAQALNVGTLHLRPVAGQSPVADIELSDKEPINPDAIRVSVATPEAYRVAGLIYHPGLTQALISAQAGVGGQTVLRLERLPLKVPAVDLLIVVSNPATMVLAEYHVDLQAGPLDIAPSPVGTRQAALARQAETAGSPASASDAPKQTPPPALPVQPAQDPALEATRSALLAWAQAWSNRDVDSYLAAYTPGYAGVPPTTHQAWATQRRERIEVRKYISVELSKLQLARQGDAVTATFDQRYQSDGPTDHMRKRVVLVWVNGRWLIQSETALK